MNSFTVTAVGNLAKNPELAVKGDTSYTRFCLVGNDYAGRDEEGAAREEEKRLPCDAHARSIPGRQAHRLVSIA